LTTQPLDELRRQRIEKLRALRDAGIEPYPHKFDVSHTLEGAINYFLEVEKRGEEQTPEYVRVAGRMTAFRTHGRASFADIRDATSKLQVYFRENTLGKEAYKLIKRLDIGDIIGIEGPVFRTRTGEITILVQKFQLLSKALRPLPEKWHGLRDVEVRYRKRYLDLIANEDVRRIFFLRSRVLEKIREFLKGKGFLEVETPMLHHIPGGAAGKAFRTYCDALGEELFLRIAPELYLKRLLVGGFDKIFEINRSFRNEGLSPRHNPEFTMLELYQAYADYEDMMSLTEELLAFVAEETLGSRKIKYQGKEIDFTPPFKRVRFADIIEENFGVKVEEGNAEELADALRKAGVQLPEGRLSRTKLINLLADTVSAEEPTFVIDYPRELCPLAKWGREDEKIAERFELFIGGLEVANAYSELNDPLEQFEQFRKQVEEAEVGEEKKIDYDYIEALEYGMPPAGGLGIGIDRLVMLLADVASIKEVILFPLMRREAEDEI